METQAIYQNNVIKPIPVPGGGIHIPEERSTKQRHFAFCANPACRENGQEFRFEVEQTLLPCPKCGATEPPMVGLLCKTHLLIRDRLGPLQSQGIRYKVACNPKREELSTLKNFEAFTDDRSVCNCIECLKAADKANAGQISGLPIY